MSVLLRYTIVIRTMNLNDRRLLICAAWYTIDLNLSQT